MSLPVLVAHTGYQPYLEFTLRQAAAEAGPGGVLLLGDRANDRFPFLRHVDGTAPAYARAAEAFARVYRHMSTNSHAFELFCFERWFRLRALMEAEGLAEALVLDSDVLLFAAPEEVRALAPAGAACALATPAAQAPFAWESSGHTSYWTAGALAAFCDFAMALYTEPAAHARLREKWQHHLATGEPGGICDMTALYLFAEAQPAGAVHPITDGAGGATVDHRISTALNRYPDEYATRRGWKALTWRPDGRPEALSRRTGAPVRFLSLHLQGQAKGHVGRLYRGPDFRGRRLLDHRLRHYHRARRLGGHVKRVAWTGLRRALGAVRR